LVSRSVHAVQRKPVPPQPWASWVEPDFPFFSSVIDARKVASEFSNNLTPRGLVLNLGRGYWVGFDTDLLRVAAMWRGESVTPKALAFGSYHAPDKKTPGGQFPAPEPDGTAWLANGIYPGWQSGDRPSFNDPREPAPSPEEVGRGALPEEMGRLTALRLVREGVVLEYTVGGTGVREWMTAGEHNGVPTIERHISVGPAARTLWLIPGTATNGANFSVGADPGLAIKSETVAVGSASSQTVVQIPAHATSISFCVAAAEGQPAPVVSPRAIPSDPPARRWPQTITTKIKPSGSDAAYVVDEIQLPVENPWRRNVRPGDVQFLRDGTGVIVTIDGDVWFARGMHEAGGTVRWNRFTSGLHEPLTLAIRDEQIYVFDRNGIWRLRDSNGDGEADVHEMFSNVFAQTADMREFPNTIRLAPGGEFVIAKGNQQATTIGKHNGAILRISADGRRYTLLGYGFRQPNLGVNIRTGLVTASDQQGHYVPSTPIHIVRDAQFYGFLSDKLPREVYPAPIAEPLTWIPHTANQSALSQVWLFGARMGPLTDSLVHIGFNNPELFRVLLNKRTERLQAAVVPVTRGFDVPPLNGSVNPADGQLYIAGFQIFGWGTTASQLNGMARVRYTGAPSTVPSELVPMDKGVLVRFDVPLDAKNAVDPDNYSLTSWHYKRTYQYGSPQYKADGTTGIDRLPASSAYVSKDGRSVFIGVPNMKPVMQMRLAWSLSTAAGETFQESAYFTPYELASFDPRAEGFGDISVDLSPRSITVAASAPASAEEGRRLYQLYGCMACHSIDNSALTKLGPPFKGLYGSQRTFAGGVVQIVADEAYLKESILSPAAKIVSGYERGGAGMPSFAGVLTDSQIDSLVLFIESLK
jgi:glucose/arabinose dehydrogenase/cytochrome c2